MITFKMSRIQCKAIDETDSAAAQHKMVLVKEMSSIYKINSHYRKLINFKWKRQQNN